VKGEGQIAIKAIKSDKVLPVTGMILPVQNIFLSLPLFPELSLLNNSVLIQRREKERCSAVENGTCFEITKKKKDRNKRKERQEVCVCTPARRGWHQGTPINPQQTRKEDEKRKARRGKRAVEVIIHHRRSFSPHFSSLFFFSISLLLLLLLFLLCSFDSSSGKPRALFA
jgi:hypothetical protein